MVDEASNWTLHPEATFVQERRVMFSVTGASLPAGAVVVVTGGAGPGGEGVPHPPEGPGIVGGE